MSSSFLYEGTALVDIKHAVTYPCDCQQHHQFILFVSHVISGEVFPIRISHLKKINLRNKVHEED